MSVIDAKPVIGFSCGDLNGIGLEIILKVLGENRLLDLCVPVVFAHTKAVNFYKKTLPQLTFNYQVAKPPYQFQPKQIYVVNCWEEEMPIFPGTLNEVGGRCAYLSLQKAVEFLQAGNIHGLVTAPLHKKNIQSPEFHYTGHTPFLKDYFKAEEVLMLMVAENMKVALVTEHVPVAAIAHNITEETIKKKVEILMNSLKRDFAIEKPKIAVLGLNPHAGDEGLVGKEEETIIKPAISAAKKNHFTVFGPYSADAFFARALYQKFDAVLAMYHDQGLIPFKSLSIGEGVNFTAGLPIVRTSPDHGTAFDIAGKNMADASSLMEAVFCCIDVIKRRKIYDESRANPLKKISDKVLANAEDEKIEEENEH
jgi:4-hydroxythreonine-4-phosphate dehydrogenase